MKLQINSSGAWRDVAQFDDKKLKAVQLAALALAYALSSPSLRIVESQSGSSPKVVASLDAPFEAWRKGQ